MRINRTAVLSGLLIITGLIDPSNKIKAQDSGMAGFTQAVENAPIPAGVDASKAGLFRDAVFSYIYGYPLVALAMTERVVTTIPDATTQQGRAPINQFYRAQTLPVGSAFKDVVLPSTTTLYAPAFLDLSKEPLILHIPAVPDNRYYIFEMLDAWTNVNRASPGSRLGTKPGDYALVGTDHSHQLPAGLAGEIDFDTNTAWIITRIYTTGTDADQHLVAGIFDQITLTPASAYGKSFTPPDNLTVNPSIDVLTQPIIQTDNMDACGFFSVMSSMMKTNPTRQIDGNMVPRLQRLGLINDDPKTQFSCSPLVKRVDGADNLDRVTLQLAMITAKEIMAGVPPPSLTQTQWSLSLDVGDYGLRYTLRAVVAQKALGANRAQDAVYGYGVFDAGKNRLNGANKYVVHFKAPTSQHLPLEIPAVKGFWSMTLYQENGTLNDNKVATWNALSTSEVQNHTACLNKDGSLDVYVQSTPPSDSQQYCNWLEAPQPAPDNDGTFLLFLRMYWPDSSITNGTWYPPAIDTN